jgi:hypothetical protein
MRRSYQSALVFAAGLILVVGVSLGLGSISPNKAGAQPRPTLTPAPATPTVVQAPTATPRKHRDKPQPTATGRITGTVIDLTTGAPAPGIAVVVGEATVTSDANGNYDRTGLLPGSYPVVLALAEGQGVPAQTGITIELTANATVVQHLFFRSQPAAGPTPVATATAPPAQLPSTNGSAPTEWLRVVLGLGAITVGAAIRTAAGRSRKHHAARQR